MRTEARAFKVFLDKFLKEPVCQYARIQIELPNGEFYDISGAKLLENRVIGSKDTHRLVLTCEKPVESMGKIIGKI